MKMRSVVVLGLGSNIGTPNETLTQALSFLAPLLDEAVASSRYQSEALLLPNSPSSWNIPFLNMAVKGYTTQSPLDLLANIQNIEQQLGRQDRGRWSPREIDIDILAYGEECFSSDTLQIPHISLLERPFALYPFVEIYPDWRYPVAGKHYGKTAKELLKYLPDDAGSIQKKASLDVVL